jgi:hypothetical protein
VFASLASKPRKIRRIISAAVLLFVFFLPLHVHFSAASQISKECSCIQGTRMQFALAPAAADCAPYVEVSFLSFSHSRFSAFHAIGAHSIRAPPTF